MEKTISFTKYTSLPTIKNVKILTPEIKVPDQSYNTYTWSSYYATTVKAIKSDKSIADDYCTTYVKNKNDVVIYFEVLLNGPGLKKDGLELLTRNGNYVIECAEGVKSDKFSIPIKLSDYTNCFLKATDSLGNSTLYKITEPSVDVSGPVISGITPSYTMTSSSSGDYIYYKYSTTHVIKINVKTNTIELYSKSKIFPSFRLNLSDTSGLYKFALSGDVSAIGGRYTTDPRTFDTSTKYLSYSVNSAQNPQTSKIWAFDKLGNVTEIEVKLYWNQTTLPTIPSN